MSAIFGALNLTDVQDARTLVNQVGQTVVYEAINQVLAAHSAALDLALSLFVEETTIKFQETYLTGGGGGYLDRLGRFAPPAATKGVGRWGVGYPLERYGRSYGGDRVTLAYMDLQTLDRHLDTIMIQDVNTTRRELIKAMINKEVWPFEDELNGPIDVQPLANGDDTLYPPTPDVQDSISENHYITSGYINTAISDVNNPLPVIRRELDEHFGQSEDNIVFVPENATPYIEDLDDFEDTGDPRKGDPAQVTLSGLPNNIPGRVVGRANHVWVVEWV